MTPIETEYAFTARVSLSPTVVIGHGPPEVIARLTSGQPVAPASTTFARSRSSKHPWLRRTSVEPNVSIRATRSQSALSPTWLVGVRTAARYSAARRDPVVKFRQRAPDGLDGHNRSRPAFHYTYPLDRCQKRLLACRAASARSL